MPWAGAGAAATFILLPGVLLLLETVEAAVAADEAGSVAVAMAMSVAVAMDVVVAVDVDVAVAVEVSVAVAVDVAVDVAMFVAVAGQAIAKCRLKFMLSQHLYFYF